MFKIVKASRYFVVYPTGDEAIRICQQFQLRYKHEAFTHYLDRDKAPEPPKMYAIGLSDNSEFRYHRNTLGRFLVHLKDKLISDDKIEITEKELPDCEVRDIKAKSHWVVRDYQKPIIEYLYSATPVNKFVGIQPGGGKATSLKELIKTPTGWKTMGDIAVGDEVIAKDGTTTRVTGVYPQGKVQLYRVLFWDGRYVDCCAEHLWKVFYVNTVKNRRWRVVNTLEVMRLLNMAEPRVYIDLCDPQDVPDVELPIDPYTLGVYIGDGSSVASTPNITTPDDFIVNEFEKSSGGNYVLREYASKKEANCTTYGIKDRVKFQRTNTFTDKLKELQLYGLVSYEKFIPEIYLHGSIKQRLSLVQGLMDTDGTAGTQGTSTYCTSSLQLAQDIQYLIRSLGGIASIHEKKPHYTYKGVHKEGRLAYIVNIRFKTPESLFRLQRKKERVSNNNQYASTLKLRVRSITPVAIEEAQCISIEHPDRLYVTTDFVVTHNTMLSLLSAAKLGLRTVIIVEGGFVTKWASDILEVLDIPAKRTMCVRGGNQLRGLIGMRGTKEFEKIDILLISSQTFQEWISMHETMVTKNHRDVGYGIEPSEFYEELEIGHRVIDEVHRRFHFNYKMDLYANPHRVTSLSATLVSYDKVMEGLYEVAYPKLERYNGGEVDKYTLAKSVIWDSYNPKKLKTKEFNRNTYSHTAFEKSIMRNALTAERYFEMISETLDIGYIANYKPGNKAAIYVATTDMATAMVAYLRKRFAGKSVERYVSTLKDPYSNLLDPDIRVSTLGSGGTGHDIKGLTDTLLTVVIQSLQANIQVFGRTRFIPDQDTRFWYFSCSGLDQHMKYHKDKVKLMNDRAKDFEILNYGIPI